MTSRVLITDYAWPDLGVQTAVLASAGIEMIVAESGEITELGSRAEYAGRTALASAA